MLLSKAVVSLSNNADELIHYGIKGQKWGVRRYQNTDGSLTEAGKKRQYKRIASNREATIAKGTTLYRISSNSESDVSKNKLYLTTTKESADFYIKVMGGGKLYRTGKIYAHEYISKNELKMPDRRTMEKVELTVFNDKQAQEEVIASLMNKGATREVAARQAAAYSSGKVFVEKLASTSLLGLAGAAVGSIGGPHMSAVGAAAGVGTALAIPSRERRRVLDIARVSYGDKNNVAINDVLVKELSKKGYNAMKDYNDRYLFKDNGKQSIMVFNSDKNLKISKISEISVTDYGKAYARAYLRDHPNSELSFDELVKTGEYQYKKRYASGVHRRNREKKTI